LVFFWWGAYHNHPLAFVHGLLIQPSQVPLKCLTGFSRSAQNRGKIRNLKKTDKRRNANGEKP
jgi:hypothetical protein